MVGLGLGCCCVSSGSGGGPIPPTGCPALCCIASSAVVEVNLGTGGLSADDCTGSGCANIKGIYDCDWRGAAPQCIWRYESSGYCQSTCGSITTCAETYSLIVEVTIHALTCKVEASVTLSLDGPDDCPCDRSGFALYRSSLAPSPLCSGSVTLSKVSENWSDACTGSLPATITVNFL